MEFEIKCKECGSILSFEKSVFESHPTYRIELCKECLCREAENCANYGDLDSWCREREEEWRMG